MSKLKDRIENNLKEIQDSYNYQMEYIEECMGEDFNLDIAHMCLGWFLTNMHNTLSKISYELCDLSNSTYDASVYISEIQKSIETDVKRYVYDDIKSIMNQSCEFNDILADIQEYIEDFDI